MMKYMCMVTYDRGCEKWWTGGRFRVKKIKKKFLFIVPRL
jgi:hypothetical protein